MQDTCTQTQIKIIKYMKNKKKFLTLLKCVFLWPNQRFYIVFVSLFGVYIFEASHSMIKLILFVSRFPLSSFRGKLTFLLFLHSSAIGVGFCIIIQKLARDLPRYMRNRDKFLKTKASYFFCRKKYETINKNVQLDSRVSSSNLRILLTLIVSLQRRCEKRLTKVNDPLLDSLSLGLPSLVKYFFYITIVLLLNRFKYCMFVMLFATELFVSFLISKINSKPVAFLSTCKEANLLILLGFVFYSMRFGLNFNLDSMLDFFVCQYYVLFVWLNYFIYYDQKLKVYD